MRNTALLSFTLALSACASTSAVTRHDPSRLESGIRSPDVGFLVLAPACVLQRTPDPDQYPRTGASQRSMVGTSIPLRRA